MFLKFWNKINKMVFFYSMIWAIKLILQNLIMTVQIIFIGMQLTR